MSNITETTSFTSKIDLTKPRYDQSTYWGRVKHFVDVTDLRTLFVSSKGLEEAKTLINDYNSDKIQDVNPKKLWNAKKIIDSTIHPDTGEPIFLPFRMSSFVPTNLVVVAGMLMPNPSIGSIIFWQWTNQSVNVAINHSNANKTTEMSIKETAIAYISAVTTSCVLAVGLTQAVPRLTFLKSSVRGILARLVPFVAVASAGTVNVYLMRMKEIRDGIDIYNDEGNNLGKSKKAGTSAVGQVAISRVLATTPVMTIPPLVLSQLEKTNLLKKNPRLSIPFNFAIITITMMTALPLAIAAFPQKAVIDPMRLEQQFWDLKNKNGEIIRQVYYNKGL